MLLFRLQTRPAASTDGVEGGWDLQAIVGPMSWCLSAASSFKFVFVAVIFVYFSSAFEFTPRTASHLVRGLLRRFVTTEAPGC